MFFVVSFVMMSSLTLLLLYLGFSLSFKSSSDREKASPFECGFTPKYSARLPFSIRFFLIAIIFLIFDVELILIFPLIPAIFNSVLYPLLLTLTLIMILLLVGLSHEIFQGSLSWAN